MVNFAIQDTEFADLAKHLEGPTAIAITEGDSTAPARILAKFAKAAEQDNLGAICAMFNHCLRQEPQDVNGAFRYAMQGANQLEPYCLAFAGMFLVRNDDPKRIRVGFEMLLEAARAGNRDAQRDLGRCYTLGIGTQEDVEQGMQWTIKAAEQGDKEAIELLNQCRVD